MSQIEHILKRPGMYIGGIEEINKENWIIMDNKIVKKEITYSPGLFKIFDELIVNAYDQTTRDNTLRTIKVNINCNTNEITVYNDGIGIDVVKHPKEKIYVPELIFGHLLTSTSFDENAIRTTGGIHGLGAKLTAVFSSYFKVEVGDPINKKKFQQIYKNNLSVKSVPIIKNYIKPNGYVKITYIPDIKYFKINKFSDDIIALMKRRVYDITALTRENIKVYLNDTKIDIRNLSEYVSLYTNNTQLSMKCDKNSINYIDKRWNIIITQSKGEFEHISFVNGINTLNGGYHVNYIINHIIKKIKEYVHKKYKTDKIKDRFIKNNLWIFMSSVIENPTFSSQTKDELMTPIDKFGSNCIISDNSIKKIYMTEGFNEIIKNQIYIMEKQDIKKISVKRKSNIINIPKLYDANYAGTNNSKQCILILTEGDSAKSMAVSGLSVIPKATNIYGVFPLKGKLINVRDMPHKRIIKNTEFINLKNILGLKIDKKYTNDNINELRYGSIILMMDADVDGTHIKGLFINMLHYYWPSLLKIDGFIKIFITPIVKVSRKNVNFMFYNNDDYNKWKKKNDYINWKIKYYKGLGTNTSAESKEYFSNLEKHVVHMIWTDNSGESIKLGFSKTQTENRKQWLKKYDSSNQNKYDTYKLTYHNFIHKELIHFSNYDNIRSLPNMIDGLKPSQRKVLYSAFKRELKNEIKVAQFVGYISEHTSYHHGEVSLSNTIINMAQNFVGSNNINLLEPKGQFGTRLLGGKDHSSPRYIFTQLNKITRFIFRKEDDEILEYLNDDGIKIEPKFYVPIIPLILVNGAEGIGTGYSTYIPKHNPIDIINAIKYKLQDKKINEIKPWYRNFTGNIIRTSKDTYITKGLYDEDNNTITIKELPIGTWTDKYREFITNLLNEHKSVRSVKHNSTDSLINITIKLNSDSKIENIDKFFALTSSINLSNMHAYDDNSTIKKFRNINLIINEFFNVRLKYYDIRKKHILKKLEHELNILESKVKFIQLVINGSIKVLNIPHKKLISILDKKKFYKIDNENTYLYLTSISIYNMTSEKIVELKNFLKNKKQIYNELKNKSIKRIWMEDLLELEKYLLYI
jgi:DNA topoisomerase-2